MEILRLASISLDVIVLILVAVLTVWYVYKQGVKQILLIHLSLYPAYLISQRIPLNIQSIGFLERQGVLFIGVFFIIWQILRLSALGKSLAISRTKKNIQYIYTITVVITALSMLLPYISSQSITSLNWIRTLPIQEPLYTVLWYTLPLVVLYFIQSSKKK